jgi:two-component system chemotaxis sensor kinase CheA
MDNADLIRRLMRTFLGEFEEHVRTLEAKTLALEAGDEDPDERVRELFRAAHSLKGAARAVNLEPLVAAAHELESLFGRAREGQLPDPEGLGVMLGMVDVLRMAATELREERPLPVSRLAEASANVAAVRLVAPGTPRALPPASVVLPAPISKGEIEPIESRSSSPAAMDAQVRVGVDKLDRLLDMAGELLVARRQLASRYDALSGLQDQIRQWERRAGQSSGGADEAVGFERLQWLRRSLGSLLEQLRLDQRQLEQAAAPLEQEILRARMVPFAQLCEGMGRAVRDLALEAHKRVDLRVRGGDIELDRGLAPGLRDALQHLLRNAVDHGLEPGPVRRSLAKPEVGQITLSARLGGGRLLVEVADDGRGLDPEALRRRAREIGIEAPEDDASALALAFEPGLSTASELTHVSGRGIGLDAVREAIVGLRGRISVDSRPGQGARFVLSLPLSLGLLPALVVRSGSQYFAFDASAVVGLCQVDTERLDAAEGRDMLVLADRVVPVAELADLLGGRRRESPSPLTRLPAVLLGKTGAEAAILVDELVVELPVVVKDLGRRLRGLQKFAGGAVLNDGKVALILEAQVLVDDLAGHRRVVRSLAGRFGQAMKEDRKRLLVVDDSVTTRALVQGLLEAAGYDVLVASDGMEAWTRLQEHDVDLVVSDVEMPRMDGIALTEAIRASRRLQQLPVVLVTALESEQDRHRGREAGADAYLVKSAFDQTELLQVIGQIL